MLVMHFSQYHSSGYNDSPTMHAVIRSFVLKMEKQIVCFGLITGTYFNGKCFNNDFFALI